MLAGVAFLYVSVDELKEECGSTRINAIIGSEAVAHELPILFRAPSRPPRGSGIAGNASSAVLSDDGRGASRAVHVSPREYVRPFEAA